MLQIVTADRRRYVRMDKGKTICLSPLRGGGLKTQDYLLSRRITFRAAYSICYIKLGTAENVISD